MRKQSPSVQSVLTPWMIESYLRSRQASPIDLTPDRLRMHLDAFERGWIRPLAQTMEQIKRLDDLLPSLSFKRETAPAVHGWEVLTTDDSATAKRHRKALEDFYNNVSCVNAVDDDERGEMSLLLRQMMHAVGYRYSCHEINWQDLGGLITAEFRYVPLEFFERRTGRLRFCPNLTDYDGQLMEPGRWMVTVGQGVMQACAIAYYYKHQPLRDWLIYCSKHGMPGTAGKTSAQPGSDAWKAMEQAVASFAAEFAAVMNKDDNIEAIDLTAKGNIPHPALVDRMDRAMTILWRGGDLSTLSSTQGEGRGASLMSDEMEILDAADSMMLSESLRMYIDRPLIQRRFGQEPLAYISIRTGTKSDAELEMKIDNHFYNMGVALSRSDLYERHNRTAPTDEEDSVKKSPTEPPVAIEPAANEASPNPDALVGKYNLLYQAAIAQDMRPLAERIAYLLTQDDDQLDAAIQELEADFPELASMVLDGEAAVKALDEAQSAAMRAGLAEGAPP